MKARLPGQCESRQLRNSECFPVQYSPPPTGEGLSHDLCRVLNPNPHVTLQVFQLDQDLQLPFTANKRHVLNVIFIVI